MPALLHSALGLLLSCFILFHAYQNYPALDHPDAWVDRALVAPISFGLGLAILAGFVAHAALGVLRWSQRRSAATRGESPRDWGSTFQLVTGALILAFLTLHVLQLWPSGAGTHASVREPYTRLWHDLGRPLYLLAYVVGVTALAFHAGHGLARLLSRSRIRLPEPLARALGGVLGIVLLFVLAQLVARFALGEALIPALS